MADSCDNRLEGSFNSQYDIEDPSAVLGHGAFCAVRVVATRREDGRKCEAKVVKRSDLPDHGLATLRREVTLLRELRHPNIIRLLDWYEEDTLHLYMVLELCEGGDLLDFIGSKTTYNEKEPRDLVRKLLETVKYMHDKGIVHRDLQPNNLLLVNRDTADFKITDFGRATKGDNPSDMCPRQCGSPEYMSPEEIEQKPCGPAVDMWSIGVISYILVAGEAPFKDSCQMRLVAKIKSGDVTFDEEVWEPISDYAQDLIQRMLIVDPVERITADDALNHSWFYNVPDYKLMRSDLGDSLKRLHTFNALRKFKAAVMLMVLASMRFGVYADIKRNEDVHHGEPSKASGRGGRMKRARIAPNIKRFLKPPPCRQKNEQDDSCGDRDRLYHRLQGHIGSIYLGLVGSSPLRHRPSNNYTKLDSPEPRVKLAHVLIPGKSYESVYHGVRLTVQPNSLPQVPQAGPIELEEVTQIISCGGEEYYVDVIVRCKPSGISFKDPLLLDFFIDDGPFDDCPEVALDEILSENQVLRDDGSGGWCIMPKEQLSIEFDEDGSILLRAYVDHFSWFTRGQRGAGTNQVMSGTQRNKRVVVMKNATGAHKRGGSSIVRQLSGSNSEPHGNTEQKQSEESVQNKEECPCLDGDERQVSGDRTADGGLDLLVVTIPTEYEPNRQKERHISVNLGYAGASAGIDCGEQGQTVRYLLPGGARPFCSTLPLGGKRSFVVGQEGHNVRFLICSLEDTQPSSDGTSNLTGSRDSSGTPSDATTDGSDEQIMRFWDNLNAYGGQKLDILPRFLDGTCQKYATVNKQEVVLADVAMALAGMGERVEEEGRRSGWRRHRRGRV